MSILMNRQISLKVVALSANGADEVLATAFGMKD
jgi:hypothetical protein